MESMHHQPSFEEVNSDTQPSFNASHMQLIVSTLFDPLNMNHFQRLIEVKELKIFFFAQRANTRKQASNRRPLPCDAMANSPEPRRRAVPVSSSSALRAADQQLYNRTSLTSWAHRGSLSKRRELVLSSLPTPPPFLPILGPRSLKLRVSLPSICSPPVCIIRSVTLLSLATTTCTPERPFFLGGGSFLVTTHGFSSRGVAAVRTRRLFPSTISGVRGSVPVLPLGQKLDWQPVLSRASKDSHLAV